MNEIRLSGKRREGGATGLVEPWPKNYIEVNRASYDALADEYRGRKEADRKKDLGLIAPFVRLLRERFDEQRIRILDVGCGGGLNVSMFFQEGFVVTGLDVSGRMLKIARETCPEAELLQGDILTYQLAKESFHGVFAKALIHLFTKDDALRVLRIIRDIMIPQGVFYVTTTVETKYNAGLRVKEDYRGNVSRYRRTWTEVELIDAIELSGFKILETSYNGEPNRNKHWFNIWSVKPIER